MRKKIEIVVIKYDVYLVCKASLLAMDQTDGSHTLYLLIIGGMKFVMSAPDVATIQHQAMAFRVDHEKLSKP